METIEFRPTKKFAFAYAFFGCVFGALIALSTYFAFPAFISFILGLLEYAKYSFNRYIITQDSLIQYSGFISSKTITVPLGKIQRVDIEFTVVQKIFKIGNIRAESAAELQDAFSINFLDVDNPEKYYAVLMERINKKN